MAGWAAGLTKSLAAEVKANPATAHRTNTTGREPQLQLDCMLPIIELASATRLWSSEIQSRGKTSGARVCLEWLDLISSLYSFLYSVALGVGMLASLPYWLYQMARHGKYRKGFAERLGRVPARLRLPGEREPVIWVHAVSVGEVLAVAGLVEELQRRFPRYQILFPRPPILGRRWRANALARRTCFISRWISRSRFVLTCGRCGRKWSW